MKGNLNFILQNKTINLKVEKLLFGKSLKAAIIGSLNLECMGGGEANTMMFANLISKMNYDVVYFGSGCTKQSVKDLSPISENLFTYIPSAFKHDPAANSTIIEKTRLLSVGLIGLFGFKRTFNMVKNFDLYYFANPSVLSRKLIPRLQKEGKMIIIANHGTFFEFLGNSNKKPLRLISKIATNFLIVPIVKYGNYFIIHTQNSFQTAYYMKLGFPEHNIIEIPQHNVNFRDYSINPKKDGFSVAFLGRLTESKGIDLLIEVANMNPEMTFNILGTGQMLHYIVTMNKHKNIILHGFVSEEQKREILASCDVMIVPSYFESLSIASIEGLASGLTLVASQSAQGLKYIIDKSKLFGVLLPRDKKYFSNELNFLWKKKIDDYENFIKKREEIRETAMNQFDEKKILQSLSMVVKCSEKVISVKR